MASIALEEYELLEDPKYRAYVAAVDKALRNFENTTEWPDLISTLGKLNKILLSHTKYPIIPRRIIISKRLAQCLHPALPSGVHLKALEIYDVIFRCIGTNRLSQELFIYSAGLFPLFGAAAMNVRSALLTIYENHFIPLGNRLRPGLNGFLAAVLSGLEEGSDHIDRTSLLLQKVADGVGQSKFYGCLWSCILNNTNIRLPAIIHITELFDKKLCTEDQLHILGTDIEVMISGLTNSLEDATVLVQRAALDLTLLLLPMHNTQLVKNDLTKILTSALTVLLRRDTSLNRRLYAWLLGSEINLSLLSSKHPVMQRLESLECESRDSESGVCNEKELYFQAFSKPVLIDAFRRLLQLSSSSSAPNEPPDLRPYKVVIPLLDKPEIGQHILDDIFLDLLRYHVSVCDVYAKESEASKSQSHDVSECGTATGSAKVAVGERKKYVNEVTKHVLLVFSSLEPTYPWTYLMNILKERCQDASYNSGERFSSDASELENHTMTTTSSSVCSFGDFGGEVCEVMKLMQSVLSLESQPHLSGVEMLPTILNSITNLLLDYISILSPEELFAGVELCKSLVEKLIPSMSSNFTSSVRRTSHSSYAAPFTCKRLSASEFSDGSQTFERGGVIQIGVEAAEQSRLSSDELEFPPVMMKTKKKNKNESASSSFSIKSEDLYRSDDSLKDESIPPSSHSLPDFPRINSLEISQRRSTCQNARQRASNDISHSEPLTVNGSTDTTFLFNYTKDFQKLFLTFVVEVLMKPGNSLSNLEGLLHQQINKHSSLRKLREMMSDCISNRPKTLRKDATENETFTEKLDFNESVYRDLLSSVEFNDHVANDYFATFKTFSSVLQVLSSLPAAAAAAHDDDDNNQQAFPAAPVSALSRKSFPRWLLGLLSCVVGGHSVSPEFSQTAIFTLIELLVLAQSDLSVWKQSSRGGGHSKSAADEEGVVLFKILPFLTPSHLQLLTHYTYFFQFMTRELWSHLDMREREHHSLSSELLLRLHSLSLPANSPVHFSLPSLSIVEKELIKYLSSGWSFGGHDLGAETNVVECCSKSCFSVVTRDATFRWITLWQVSRSLSKFATELYPYLSRCLFLMIERLQSKSVLEKSYSQIWISDSLNWGDLPRILDPILTFLLHPHTRRVSMQHVVIEKLSAGSSQSHCSLDALDVAISESQIYAISSVGGEVMYHVSKMPLNREKYEGTTTITSSVRKQALALSSLSQKSCNQLETREIHLSDYEMPSNTSYSGGRSQSISLMINPFSQHPWIDFDDLTKLHHSSTDDVRDKFLLSNLSLSRKKSGSAVEGGGEEPPKDSSPKWTSKDLVRSLMDDMLDAALAKVNVAGNESECVYSPNEDSNNNKDSSFHFLHSHMLLYAQLVDVGQCLYAFNLLKNILVSESKLFLISLASTSISSRNSCSLLLLLARHRRSVFGEGFESGSTGELIGQFRSTMYLQVVITVCLYFIRSYYPQLPHLRVDSEHLRDNSELQIVAAEVLRTLFVELIPLVADSRRGFSSYVKDLLSKCKVQKSVVHCLLSTAYMMKRQNYGEDDAAKSLTEDILDYNFNWKESENDYLPLEQPYLFSLMDLTLVLMKMEFVLVQNKSETTLPPPPPPPPHDFNDFKSFSISSLRYVIGQPIPSQAMYLWSVLLVLSQSHLRYFHSHWINFFVSSLPYAGSALPVNVLRVVTHLCLLVEDLSVYYQKDKVLPETSPCDYSLQILSGLTSIVHFCLLESSTLTSNLSVSTPSSPNVQSSSQILSNLFHVFSSSGDVLEASVDTTNSDPAVCARKTLLSHLPRLVAALLSLWVSASSSSSSSSVRNEDNFALGSRQAVKQQIVELLSPIGHHHTSHLLAAFGVVWQGISTSSTLSNGSLRKSQSCHMVWSSSKDQQSLVEMLAALRVLPLHSLIENVKQILRSPPVIEETLQQKTPVEVSILQLFYLYVKETATSTQLAVCWGPFLGLVREGLLCLPPPALLILLASLNEFVQRAPSARDKKEVKEQQDVTVKLLDAVSAIAGSKLEPTTWLRRNLTVRQNAVAVEDEKEDVEFCSEASSYSVSALSVMATLLAPLLDVLYTSEEKERVVPLLVNIMSNVVPYLRNHSSGNVQAFHAASQLLSSLSSYQYTLKAWRKDVLELLLDLNTFRMSPQTLPHWKVLVDNLCTHDKTVFKELLGRLSSSQGGSLNLFVSKEAEYEMRACLLKRLAFTIFCSELDQYLKLIPDIQERLTEVTRLDHVVPDLVSQVFLCFRVLLLRISSSSMTSLWPIIITELVQVLLMIEHQLSTDSDQFSSHLKRLSNLDSRWVVSTQNGLQAHDHPAWLSLYLQACKLLDLMLGLPASHLPQFQMYRWAFVGSQNTQLDSTSSSFCSEVDLILHHQQQHRDFVPHVIRIARLINQKWPPLAENDGGGDPVPKPKLKRLFLSTVSIATIKDLQPFFNALVSWHVTGSGKSVSTDASSPGKEMNAPPRDAFEDIEDVIGTDFLEPVL